MAGKVADVLASVDEQLRVAYRPPLVATQRFGHNSGSPAGAAGGAMAPKHLQPPAQPAEVIGLAAAPLGHVRQFDLGAVGVAGFQVNERLRNALAQLIELIVAGR